jgi:hypothetical protein
MTDQSPELQSVRGRLEKLEKQNRRLRRVGVGALMVVASVLLMGQARTSRTVTASKFVLLDSHGRARITIATPASMGTGVAGMGSDDPGIWISDEKGQERCMLTDDGMRLADGGGRPAARLTGYGYTIYGEGGAALGLPDKVSLDQGGLFFTRHGASVIVLGVVSPVYGKGLSSNPPRPALVLLSADGSQASMQAGTSPSLRLADAQGYSTVVGSAEESYTTTGETRRTSAASLVMFGKDRRELWSAPPK